MKIAKYVLSVSALTAALAIVPIAAPHATAQQVQSDADQGWQKEFDSWRAAAKAGKVADYQKYLVAYPSGKFASVAKRRIEQLESTTAKAPSAAGQAAAAETTNKDGKVETRAAEFSEPAKESSSTEAQKASPSSASESEAAQADDMKAGSTETPKEPAADETEVNPVETPVQNAAEPTKPVVSETDQTAPAEDKDYESWKKAAAANTEGDYKTYLETYPQGTFAALAKARIVQLQAKAAPEVKKESDGSVVHIQVPPKTEQTAKQTMEPETDSDVSKLSKETPTDKQLQKQSAFSLAMEFEAGLNVKARISVQKRLGFKGYNAGGADGNFGPRTRAAISQWQADNGFEPTGFLQKKERILLNQQTMVEFMQMREREKAERKQRMAEQRALRRQREVLVRPSRQREYIIEGEVDPYDPYYAERRVYRVYPDEY